MHHTTADRHAGTRNRWLILAVICIPVFVGSLDLTVVSAFLPELVDELNIDLLGGIDNTAWVLTASGLTRVG